ncbi:metallophosphoesterase [Smaragdicoccus niigatensis]|uniref:metallophosphoesterase n=1 Tax=Smaragdicoccus niigatensis TaxID=359359 RepID=UPI000380DD53|nr:metallophosphoesterase [Smaragdicoccus niigatensis]
MNGSRIAATLAVVITVLFTPIWFAVVSGPDWGSTATAVGTALVVAAALALPTFMVLGHGPRRLDRAAVAGDTMLGATWVLFTWSILGLVARAILEAFDVSNAGRFVGIAVPLISAALLVYGFIAAMRVPRVVNQDVVIDRLDPDLDGLRIVAITDTHYGPINRSRWSEKVVDLVNSLEADLVFHVGDLADGTPDTRFQQTRPLVEVKARLGRAYVTGNHEYFSEAQEWLDYMANIGWSSLHNAHIVVGQGDGKLVVAGIDDFTAQGSGLPGHGANLAAALEGADPSLPVVLLAHQPKQVFSAAEAGVDLQIAGHTHGGQIWPFRYLVRLDQPAVNGLQRFGKTQLYTSRGTGFWGPPFRVFAPSEVTVLTLRTPHQNG